MSEHDEREDYDDEPWRGDRLAPDHVVRWPTSVMWGLGLMQLVFTQTFIVMMVAAEILVGFVDGGATLNDLWQDSDWWRIPPGWLVLTGCNVFVIRTASEMRRFRHYWRVVSSTVLVMFAVPFIFLTVIQLPLGIWILVVLCRRDVRARFQAVARGTMIEAPPETPDARADRSP